MTSARRGDDMHDRAGTAALAECLRRRRKQLGLSQEELADLAGASTRFVHTLEAGKSSVRLDKMLDVLRILGLHLELRPGMAEGIEVRDQ